MHIGIKSVFHKINLLQWKAINSIKAIQFKQANQNKVSTNFEDISSYSILTLFLLPHIVPPPPQPAASLLYSKLLKAKKGTDFFFYIPESSVIGKFFLIYVEL